jgi:hypothetical protein
VVNAAAVASAGQAQVARTFSSVHGLA